MILLVSISVFLSLVILTLAMCDRFFSRTQRQQRSTARRVGDLGASSGEGEAGKIIRSDSLSTIPGLDRLLRRISRIAHLKRLLHEAGNPCNLATLLLIQAALGLLGLLVGNLNNSTLLALGLAGAGISAPFMWLRSLRQRRLNVFEEQFVEVVGLLGRALRAGHSFGSALGMIREQIPDPAGEEFGRTFDEYSVGKSLNDALNSLVDRIGTKDVKFFRTAVTMQMETGGNLAEMLDTLGDIIRQRFVIKGQIRALSTEGRLTGWLLALVGPALLVALTSANYSYVEPLYTTPTGQTVLGLALGFQFLGVLVIRRIVNLKV